MDVLDVSVVAGTKIRIGNGSAELINLTYTLIERMLDVLTQVKLITVTCAAPSSPSGVPLNAAAFIALEAQITTIKTSLDLIKG